MPHMQNDSRFLICELHFVKIESANKTNAKEETAVLGNHLDKSQLFLTREHDWQGANDSARQSD